MHRMLVFNGDELLCLAVIQEKRDGGCHTGFVFHGVLDIGTVCIGDCDDSDIPKLIHNFKFFVTTAAVNGYNVVGTELVGQDSGK